VPRHLQLPSSQSIPGSSTRIGTTSSIPCRHIRVSNYNFRQFTLNFHYTFRPSTKPIPIPITDNRGNFGPQRTPYIMNGSTIFVKQVPRIGPQENAIPISHFEPKKLLGHSPKLEKFLPTPRTRMGNKNLQKALPLKTISFHPCNPQRSCLCKQVPNVV